MDYWQSSPEYEYASAWLHNRLTHDLQTNVRVYIERMVAVRGVRVTVGLQVLGDVQYGWSRTYDYVEWEAICPPAERIDLGQIVDDSPMSGVPCLMDVANEAAGAIRTAVRGAGDAKTERIKKLEKEFETMRTLYNSSGARLVEAEKAIADLERRNRRPWWKRVKRG